MKNLKKTLALMLVVVMALGLVPFAPAATAASDTDATAAAAATDAAFDPTAPATFPDLDDVNPIYATVIQFFAKAGLAQGKADTGGLAPKDTLTRAEAATILARLLLGVDAAGKLPMVKTKFIDVDEGFWGSAAINYVTGAGLMVGKGNPTGAGETFGPDDQLSIAQWQVVMLRLAGYGQAGEFSGGQWAYNAERLTKDVGLHNGATAPFYKVPQGVLIDYDDHMAEITREKAYAFIWNNIWYVEEVAYQYGSYRPKNVNVNIAGGNTNGTFVGQALGFSKGWLSDSEGFGDITGEFYAYEKAAEGKYITITRGIDTFTGGIGSKTELAAVTNSRNAVMTTADLSKALTEGRILQLDFPTGPSTEAVRTAIRSLTPNTSATNWPDTLVRINGAVLKYYGDGLASYSSNSSGFWSYLDAMPDRSPAFGYESTVKVWAEPNNLAGRTGEWNPLRATVKLPALAQIGDKVLDDPYTHLVNEAGLGITVLRAVPENAAQFEPRESADGSVDIRAVMPENNNSRVYRELSAMTKGDFVSAYLQGIGLTLADDASATAATGAKVLRLSWPNDDTPSVMTADPIKQETVSVTAKRTGYLTIAGEGEVNEATWIVGESPYPDASSYQIFRDRFGTVIGTNAVFQGRNPFAGILRVVSVDGPEDATEALFTDTSGYTEANSLVTVTAELLGETNEYGDNVACTVTFTVDIRQAVATWLTGASVNEDGRINKRVTKMSELEDNFYRYSYTINYGVPVFRLQYLNPNQYQKLSVMPTAATDNWKNYRTVTYMWTQGYDENLFGEVKTDDPDLGRFVRTYTEKSTNRLSPGERNIYDDGSFKFWATDRNTPNGSNAPQIARLSGGKIVEIGIINPYELSAPREFAFFTGKLSYTRDDWYIGTFLMDGKRLERKVDTVQFDLVASDNNVGFYNIVGNFYEKIVTLYQIGPERAFGTGNNTYMEFNPKSGGIWKDDIESADRYTLNYAKMSSNTARTISTLYPWAQHSQWRDVKEDDLSPTYTNALGSEDAITIYIVDKGIDDKTVTSNVTMKTYESNTTQAWIVPDRYYKHTDLVRLGLTGEPPEGALVPSTPAVPLAFPYSPNPWTKVETPMPILPCTFTYDGKIVYYRDQYGNLGVFPFESTPGSMSDFLVALTDTDASFSLNASNEITRIKFSKGKGDVSLPVLGAFVSSNFTIDVEELDGDIDGIVTLEITGNASWTGSIGLLVIGNDTDPQVDITVSGGTTGRITVTGAKVALGGATYIDSNFEVIVSGSLFRFANPVTMRAGATLNVTVTGLGSVDLTNLSLGSGRIGTVNISGTGTSNLAGLTISVRLVINLESGGSVANIGQFPTGASTVDPGSGSVGYAASTSTLTVTGAYKATITSFNASATSLPTATGTSLVLPNGGRISVGSTGIVTVQRPTSSASGPVWLVVNLLDKDDAILRIIRIEFIYGANPSTEIKIIYP